VDPAIDHRLVHRVAADTRLGDDGGFDLCERLVNVCHLGTLGTLRPDAAIISRITSFTPPPKVITKLRLVCESSQSSSSAVSDSAGLPYLPTISSASRPMYWMLSVPKTFVDAASATLMSSPAAAPCQFSSSLPRHIEEIS